MKNPNAPTFENIAKMIVGAFAGAASIAAGFYVTYLAVVMMQTY